MNVLFAGERHVADLTFAQNENSGQTAKLRKAIFDLCCTGSDGEQFIIEMQRVNQRHFLDRCLYYTASLIRDQVDAGESSWQYDLKPVYLIGLMDFCFKDSVGSQYLHQIRLVNRNDGEVFYDKFGLTFIEMPRFTKAESELVTDLDRWLFLLKNLSNFSDIPAGLQQPVFHKVFRIAEVCNLNQQEKMAWDAYLKAKWDNENSLAYAKEEAEEAGMAKGLQAGKEEGIELGHQEAKLQIARNMKAKGFDLETIAEVTGLTPQEVQGA